MIHLRAQNKGLAFSFEIAPDVPALVVGDEKRLSQVLLNLLGNAVKFTDRGSVTLKIENCQLNSENYRGEEGHHQSSIFQPVSGQASILQFSITDTGPGIPEDQRENIFSPFVQIGDHTRKRKGTGLGLAISRQLVRLMGGELEVASRAGPGSTFWFEIPLLLQEVSELAARKAYILQKITGYKGTRRTIMVVDDNTQNRMMLVELLRPLGFRVMEANDGRDALNQLAVCSKSRSLRSDVAGNAIDDVMPSLLDLILLDLIMPVMDGVEVASHVRNSSELRQIKIIVVSANTSLSNQKQMAKIGCDGFIAKPIHIDVLLNRLCLHLDLEWIFDASSESPPEALPLVFPPQEDLEILLDLAKGGYVTDIRKTLARLKETEPELVPFVSRLEDMANSFQFKQIIELIMSAKNQ